MGKNYTFDSLVSLLIQGKSQKKITDEWEYFYGKQYTTDF